MPRDDAASFTQTTLTKVPMIIAFFWLTKVATTAMGETTSDWMNGFLGPAIAIPLMLIGLVWALRRQFRADRYDAWTYWTVVVMVAIFGTSAADALHVGLGIPYLVSTIFYAVVLAAIFAVWHRVEGTLSIHSIRTKRREAFYWATVLATFALGTACGDMTATTLHLGYFGSGVHLRRADRDPLARPPLPRPERGPRLLDGLRPHPSARRLVRRLDGGRTAPRRPRSRRRRRQR